jgi:hypothetical protein
MTTQILNRSSNYTARDFTTLKLRMEDLLVQSFPQWTDFTTPTFGNILKELMCDAGDLLSYYQDARTAEVYTATMSHRVSAIKLGQVAAFFLSGAESAGGTVTFSIPAVHAVDITIPIGTKLTSNDPDEPLDFRTTTVAVITAGLLSASATVEQAESHTETFLSDDTPNQTIFLSHSPLIDGSVSISAVNGAYTKKDSFYGTLPADRVYTVLVDQEDFGQARFGNGSNGALPTGSITVSYKTGGGVKGRVDPGTIVNIEEEILDANSQVVDLDVTNAAQCTGGADRMSVAEAKLAIPAHIAIGNRTVTKPDFENGATTKVRGVARALMATSNEHSGIAENTGIIYVVAQGSILSSGRVEPATPSATLLAQVEAYYATKPATITFTYQAKAAIFKLIHIALQIHIAQGYTASTVGAAVKLALRDFFAVQLEPGVKNPSIDFGSNLKDVNGVQTPELVWSDVFNAARDIAGVRKIPEGSGLLLNSLRQSVTLNSIDFPKVGTIALTNADTGQLIA